MKNTFLFVSRKCCKSHLSKSVWMLKIERQLHFHMNENTNIFCCLERFAFNKHFYEISKKLNLDFFSYSYFFRFARFTYHNSFFLLRLDKFLKSIRFDHHEHASRNRKTWTTTIFKSIQIDNIFNKCFFFRKSSFKFDTINQFDLTRFNIQNIVNQII